jgi:hypothetical protein
MAGHVFRYVLWPAPSRRQLLRGRTIQLLPLSQLRLALRMRRTARTAAATLGTLGPWLSATAHGPASAHVCFAQAAKIYEHIHDSLTTYAAGNVLLQWSHARRTPLGLLHAGAARATAAE